MDSQSPGAEEGPEEEEEESESMETSTEHPASGTPVKVVPRRRSCFLTRRGITLKVLLKDALIEPGDGVLSINYLGKIFVGDLLADGKIRWQETGQVFNSPSAWATHCKKLINPAKKSGCGWASVKYKGQRLDQFKTIWLKKHQSNIQTMENQTSEGEDDEGAEENEAREGKTPISDDNRQNGKRTECKIRTPVCYATLGARDSTRDPHTLVEVNSFSACKKFQPFNVTVSSNMLLLVDFHSHLTKSEVVGYLGGKWDTRSQLLTVLQAFPCRTRLGDVDSAAAVEEDICRNLLVRGLSLVGWYHSHPINPAAPSLQDIDAQTEYQLKLQSSENRFQPCLALICGPYYHGNPGLESSMSLFWVMAPAEQRTHDYGMPLEVEATYVQDTLLTNDVLHDMMLLVEFYKRASDMVKFQDIWNEELTYLDKLKGSLACRTPKEQQGFSVVLEQVFSLLKHIH